MFPICGRKRLLPETFVRQRCHADGIEDGDQDEDDDDDDDNDNDDGDDDGV